MSTNWALRNEINRLKHKLWVSEHTTLEQDIEALRLANEEADRRRAIAEQKDLDRRRFETLKTFVEGRSSLLYLDDEGAILRTRLFDARVIALEELPPIRRLMMEKDSAISACVTHHRHEFRVFPAIEPYFGPWCLDAPERRVFIYPVTSILENQEADAGLVLARWAAVEEAKIRRRR